MTSKSKKSLPTSWTENISSVEDALAYIKFDQKNFVSCFAKPLQDFSDNEHVVRAAVRINGSCISHVSTRLRRDRSIVLDALKSSGSAIQWLESDQKNDRELVMTALHNNPWSFQFLLNHPTSLKHDSLIIETVLSLNGGTYAMLTEEERHNKYFLKRALQSMSSEIGIHAHTALLQHIPKKLLVNIERRCNRSSSETAITGQTVMNAIDSLISEDVHKVLRLSKQPSLTEVNPRKPVKPRL